MLPDHCIEPGIEVLRGIEALSPCSLGESCPSSLQRRHSPSPSLHMHLNGSDTTANLYVQSQTLWFLPPLDVSLSSPQETQLPPHLILASDHDTIPRYEPGRGSGVFPSDLYPVLVPTALVLLEAYIRIYARDVGTRMAASLWS